MKTETYFLNRKSKLRSTFFVGSRGIDRRIFRAATLFVLPIFTLALTEAASAANAEGDVVNGKTDLTAAATYSPATAPATTTDVAFTNVTYSPTTFTVGANLGIGTLNDLDATQSLLITNNTVNSTLTLNGGGDTVAGSTSTDLIYLAPNTNLTFQNGGHTLALAFLSGITGTFNVGAGSNLTINSNLTGAFTTTGVAFIKSGTGTMTLAGTNSFGGGGGRRFGITAGTVNLNSNTALGNIQTGFYIGTVSNQTVTIDNTSGSAKSLGTNGINWNTNFTFTGSSDLSFAGDVSLGNTTGTTRTVTVGAGTLTMSGLVSSGTVGTSITKAGAGTLALSNTGNSYTGLTTISSGALSISSIENLNVASAVGAPTTSTNGTIAIGSTATAGALIYTGTGSVTNRIINLAGTTGGATLDQSGTGNLEFTSSFTATTAGTKTLTLQGSTAGTGQIDGTIVNGSGTTSVSKTGTGTWTLSGTNSYTGGTSVLGGTLAVNGTIGAASVSGTGSILKGSGTIGAVSVGTGGTVAGTLHTGALNVQSGGIISPGNSPGVLSSTSATFASAGSYVFQMDNDGSTGSSGVNWDKLALTGNLNISSLTSTSTFGLTLQTLDGSDAPGLLASFDPATNHTWASIITTGGSTGTFNSNLFAIDTTGFQNALSGTFGLVQNGNNFDLVYTAVVPEPGTWAMMLGGLGLLVAIQRRKSRSSY